MGTPSGLASAVCRFLGCPRGAGYLLFKKHSRSNKGKECEKVLPCTHTRLAQSHSMTREAVPKLSDGSGMSTGFVTQDYLE